MLIRAPSKSCRAEGETFALSMPAPPAACPTAPATPHALVVGQRLADGGVDHQAPEVRLGRHQAQGCPRGPIGFEFQIVVKDEAARAVRAGGLKLESGGEGLARISGTVGKPEIR